VGVTGGIAAYKTATLVSRLAQAGAKVTVAMSPAAQRFVTPLTFQALSGRPVYADIWDQADLADPQHIRLARAAQLAIVAPASMDFLARLAAGMADEPVSLILSAVDCRQCPVLLAPSMNEVMWSQPATVRNLHTLRGDGYEVIDPANGWQACRTSGPGRMPEPEDLLAEVRRRLLGA
jgi:phosphopantothenoylcysteine synthetase/decarboxylase